jgi:hypothetical protein
MSSFSQAMEAYRQQLQQGLIQEAYRGLMAYLMDLRTHFQHVYPDYFVSGSIYYGYMDMSYFAVSPRPLKQRNLKVAVVFLHPAFRFEAWLAGANRQAQARYWRLFKESGCAPYPLVATTKGRDAILEHFIVDQPDFSDLTALTRKIEHNTLDFIQTLTDFLQRFP